MKKIVTTTMVALVGLFSINTANAQFETENLSFGAGLGYTGYSNLGGGLTLNARGNYSISEKLAVAIGYTFMLPVSEKYTSTANAFSSATSPGSVSVDIESSALFQNISADAHYYFVRDIEESFGLYGIVGVGLTFVSISNEVGSYDKSNYGFGTTTAFEDISETGFIIDLGLGTNINVSDNMAIFGEAKIGLPAGNDYNSRTGATITNPIPFCYGLAAGVRFKPFQ
jgi:opacity protein-like surface antigen